MNINNLEDFSRHLAPNAAILEKVNAVIEKVVAAIQNNGRRIGVSRTIVSGSMGKKTNIMGAFDVDLVIFINDDQPPFGEKLDRIKELIGLNFEGATCHERKYSLKCNVLGVSFDILLAANLVAKTSGESPRRAQHKQLLSLFSSPSTTFKDVRPYSCAFCETTVDFIKNQDDIVHSAIRLAKLWLKSLVFADHRYGLSFGDELLIVHAAEGVRKEHGIAYSVLLVFNAFLRKLVDWQSLVAYWTTYYDKELIPASCFVRCCHVAQARGALHAPARAILRAV